MRMYLLSVVLGLSLVACGGGGDSSESNINRPSIVEVSKIENITSNLVISDYILNDGAALEKSKIDMTLSGFNKFSLFDGDDIIADGYIYENMDGSSYAVNFWFFPNLPDHFFKDDAAKNLRGLAYSGLAHYEPDSKTFKMNVKKRN